MFAGALLNGFTFDDPHIVAENPAVLGEEGWLSLLTTHYWSGEKPTGALWRPLTLATYRLNRDLTGPGPFGFHLVNILLHGIAALLVCLLLRRLAGEPVATLSALLFATHPIHTEAVASIVGRAELLAALFVLAAWLLRERPWTSASLFLLAMLSKESAAIFPALLVAEDVLMPRAGVSPRAPWRRYALHAAALVIFLAARFQVVGPVAGDPAGPFAQIDPLTRILTAVGVLGRGLFLMLFPVKLSADYSFDQIPLATGALDPAFLAGLGALAACVAAGVASWRRARAIPLGLAIYFVALLPVSNLLIGIGVMMAERLFYLPSVGFCLASGAAIAWLAGALSPRRAVAAATLVTLLVAGAYAARSARRTGDWFDQLTLFEATVGTSPRSALAQINLGGVYAFLGRAAEAEEAWRRAIAIAPHFPSPRYSLGGLLLAQKRYDEAVVHLREAARLKPDDCMPVVHLAEALKGQGKAGEADELLSLAKERPGLRGCDDLRPSLETGGAAR